MPLAFKSSTACAGTNVAFIAGLMDSSIVSVVHKGELPFCVKLKSSGNFRGCPSGFLVSGRTVPGSLSSSKNG